MKSFKEFLAEKTEDKNTKVLNVGAYQLKLVKNDEYEIGKTDYKTGIFVSYDTTVKLSKDVVQGYIKKPHSGYYIDAITKIVKKQLEKSKND